MPGPALLAGLLAKVSGLGTAAKAALAGATAVTTLGMAGGGAGVLPGPAQDVVSGAVGAVTPFELPEGKAAAAIARATAPVAADVTPAHPPVSVAAGATAGSATSSAMAPGSIPSPSGGRGAGRTGPGVTTPTLPQVTVPPAVAGLVGGLPSCVKDLVPAAGAVPDPATLAARIQACIPQVLDSTNLPPEVARCVSAVLGAIGGASGMNPASVPGVTGLTLSSCVPMDASKCVNGMLSFLATMPGVTSRIPAMGSVPGVAPVSGCAPMDVRTCITSITSAVKPATTPTLDLSACMPTTAPAPGLPGGASLPGLAGALAFFGR